MLYAECACGNMSSHILDGKYYCCKCFDLIVENCGNIKLDLPKLDELVSYGHKFIRMRRSGRIRKDHDV